ncbi:MAG: hypothetical protein N2169_04390 [bacterium]|nr:hypothetical protein [bacterium]
MKIINTQTIENLKKVKIPNFNETLILEIIGPENDLHITSHQPLIYTPGVISKFLYKKKEKIIVYNDSDKAEFNFLSNTLNLNKPIEKLEKQDITKLREFINHSYHHFEKIIEKQEIIENINVFLSILNNEPLDKFTIFWHNILTKYLEKYRIKLNFEIKLLSDLSKNIKDFFNWVIENYNNFYELYNESIHIFKKNLGFYPTKELEKGETPFWIIKGNLRKTVYYNNKITDENGDNIDLEDFKNIRPKAVAWAIYRRYFLFNNVTDVLGIGSSYYNFVSDYIATNLLNKSPLPTTIVSLSIPLKIDNKKINNLKSIINAFKTTIFTNPEKLKKILIPLKEYENLINLQDIHNIVNKIDYYIDKTLIKQKSMILEEINKKENRKIKKELTQKIKQINQQIIKSIENELQELNKLTEIIEFQIEKIFDAYKATNSRDYPYFFLTPQEIIKALENEKN